jgi:hypothetical protein
VPRAEPVLEATMTLDAGSTRRFLLRSAPGGFLQIRHRVAIDCNRAACLARAAASASTGSTGFTTCWTIRRDTVR